MSSKEQNEEEMKGEIVLGKTINAFIDLAAAAAKEQLLLLCGQQTSLEVRPPPLPLAASAYSSSHSYSSLA